jgi:hypothetical protein
MPLACVLLPLVMLLLRHALMLMVRLMVGAMIVPCVCTAMMMMPVTACCVALPQDCLMTQQHLTQLRVRQGQTAAQALAAALIQKGQCIDAQYQLPIDLRAPLLHLPGVAPPQQCGAHVSGCLVGWPHSGTQQPHAPHALHQHAAGGQQL